MKATYTRMFNRPDGRSDFATCDLPLAPGFAVPPAEPLFSAPFLTPDSTYWVGGLPEWKGDAPHPTPRRQIFVFVRGSCVVTVGTGETRTFRPGDVVLLEDTEGTGHETRIIGGEEMLLFAIGLPPAT